MSSVAVSPAAAETLPSEQVDLRREFNEVGIGDVLDQLDRELIGLKPVKTRIPATRSGRCGDCRCSISAMPQAC